MNTNHRNRNTGLSIVIPVYNEEQNVGILYDEIRKALDPLKQPYEIIFIDDGSSDRTMHNIRKIKEREKRDNNGIATTRIIKFLRNFGQTSAMQAGFDHARGKFIVSLDGDLQNDPNDIPKLIDRLHQGYDIVCGWRKDRQDKTLTRIIPSKAANWLIARLTGIAIHDNGCSLKAYRSSVIKSVKMYSDMHRFIPSLASIFGANVTEIVVNHRPRKFGETKYGLSRIWKVFFDMVTIKMLIQFHNRPILWFFSIGLIFFICGVFLGIIAVYLFVKGEDTLVFGSSSFLFLAAFAGLLCWGFFAEFINTIEKKSDTSRIGIIYVDGLDID